MYKQKNLLLFLALQLAWQTSHARFISEDAHPGKADIAPSLHKYLYAYQNPTVYVDRDGNFSLEAHTEMTNAAMKQAHKSNVLRGKNSNFVSRQVTSYGAKLGSREPDTHILGSAAYEAGETIDRWVPDEVIEKQVQRVVKPVSDWVGKQKDAAFRRIAPEAYETVKTGQTAWDDSDTGGPISDGIDEHLPNLRVKDSYLYRSHYGDQQFKHAMGNNTAKVVQESVDGIVAETRSYWRESDLGESYAAGRALGRALHTVQDSYSEGHVARGPDGRIRKTFDFNGQSPKLHSHDDEVSADHPSRRAALDASNEYLRLAEQYRGDTKGLRTALNEGIFSKDVDESIPQPNQVRVTVDEAQERVDGYIKSKREDDN